MHCRDCKDFLYCQYSHHIFNYYPNYLKVFRRMISDFVIGLLTAQIKYTQFIIIIMIIIIIITNLVKGGNITTQTKHMQRV